MKVRHLIYELMEMNLDAEVLLSIQNEEGNWDEYKAEFTIDYDKEFDENSNQVAILCSWNERRTKC